MSISDKMKAVPSPFLEGVPPGVVYTKGEPEYFGSIPIRTELTVLPSSSSEEPVGWVGHNIKGYPVALDPEKGDYTPTSTDLEVGTVIYTCINDDLRALVVTKRNKTAEDKLSGKRGPLRVASVSQGKIWVFGKETVMQFRRATK